LAQLLGHRIDARWLQYQEFLGHGDSQEFVRLLPSKRFSQGRPELGSDLFRGAGLGQKINRFKQHVVRKFGPPLRWASRHLQLLMQTQLSINAAGVSK
jgi:hypothetical protein